MDALSIVRERFPNVKKVVDAKRPIIIEVTKKDCNSALVKNHQQCAMAVAAKRQLKSVDGVMISLKTAYVVKGDRAVRFSVPGSLGREVTSFDRKAGFEPGDYQLSAVPPAARLGVHRGKGGNRSSTGKGINHKFQHKTENVRSRLGSKDYRAESSR